mgnify:CR=1 FL=1
MKNQTPIIIGVFVLIAVLVLFSQKQTCANDSCNAKPNMCETNPLACEQDSDCVCKEAGAFKGNVNYYENCVDKTKYLAEGCGFMSPIGTPHYEQLVGTCVKQLCEFKLQ